ncbi:MAG: carboxypeptidase-like regulatory domain-containing protein [Planctomycetota bacterium]
MSAAGTTEATANDPSRRSAVEAVWFPARTALRIDKGANYQAPRGSGSLILEVVSRTDGTPIEDYGWTAERLPGAKVVAADIRDRGRHREGLLEVTDLAAGEIAVKVWPTDDRWAPSRMEATEIREGGPSRLRVVLDEAARLEVVVLEPDRTPVAGVEVCLVHETSGRWRPGSWVGGHKLDAQVRSTGIVDRIVSYANCDTKGRCTLMMPPALEPLLVSVEAEGYSPTQYPVPPGYRSLEFILPRQSRIVGRCVPAEALEQIIPGHVLALRGTRMPRPFAPANSLSVRLATDTSTGDLSGGRGYRIDADGSFEIPGLPAGRYRLYLAGQRRNGKGGFTSRQIEVIELRSGETREIVLDLSAWIPADTELELLMDGLPLADHDLRLYRNGLDAQAERPRCLEMKLARTDGDGHCSLGKLTPGTWHVQVIFEDAQPTLEHRPGNKPESARVEGQGRASEPRILPRPVRIFAGEPFRLSQAQAGRIRVDLHRRRIVIAVSEEDGQTPAVGRTVRIRCADPIVSYEVLALTDEHGRVTLDPAPMIPFEVRLWPMREDPAKTELPPRYGRKKASPVPRTSGIPHGPYDPATWPTGKVIALKVPADG